MLCGDGGGGRGMSGPLHSLRLRALRQMRFRLLIQFPDAVLYSVAFNHVGWLMNLFLLFFGFPLFLGRVVRVVAASPEPPVATRLVIGRFERQLAPASAAPAARWLVLNRFPAASRPFPGQSWSAGYQNASHPQPTRMVRLLPGTMTHCRLHAITPYIYF